jgi:membrane fusion protein (multidrug efflux system)
MSSPFSRTLRAVESDRFRSWPAIVLVAGFLGAWTAWFVLARVPLYETTAVARIEAADAVHPVDARIGGRAVRVHLVMGTPVRAGDVLVELEADVERLALQEARARVDALAPEIAAVRREIAAEERAIADEQRATLVARDEQRAILREAQAARSHAEEEAARIARLLKQGLVPELEDVRVRAEVEQRRAVAEAAAAALARVEQDQRTRESDRLVRVQRARGTLSRLEGDATTAAATIKRLEYEVERRILRAPIEGRIAEAAELRIGAVVHEGDRLAAIVPTGALRVVAQFPPASAIGRVRRGQHGRVRLSGFPWAEYGSLHASVSGVADEVRNGLVRVEMTVDSLPVSLPARAMTHALPGTVEIEVERVHPASLVLRTLGEWLTWPVETAPSRAAGS